MKPSTVLVRDVNLIKALNKQTKMLSDFKDMLSEVVTDLVPLVGPKVIRTFNESPVRSSEAAVTSVADEPSMASNPNGTRSGQ